MCLRLRETATIWSTNRGSQSHSLTDCHIQYQNIGITTGRHCQTSECDTKQVKMAVTCLKLVTIDYKKVEQALANPAQREFNTSFHSTEEAPGLNRPSEDPYSFKRWLGLILSTRDIALQAVQAITLSRSQARLLLDAAEGSLQTRTVNRMFAEDIDEEIEPLLRKHLVFPPEGLFLRLDACSLKDGAHLVPSVTKSGVDSTSI